MARYRGQILSTAEVVKLFLPNWQKKRKEKKLIMLFWLILGHLWGLLVPLKTLSLEKQKVQKVQGKNIYLKFY